VSALFLQREVTVDFIEVPDTTFGDDSYTDCPTHTVSKKCYVYEVNPLLKRDVNGRKMCVKLNIFSMDKLMTLNKYSKAYVARKLGEQILKPESLTFGTKTDGTTPLVKTLTDLRFLFYEENNEKREFIQPYLVQYNESFYDFLVRTANRCGEFLYFEDGALTLGLPDSGDPLVIDDYMSVTEQGVSTDPLEITAYRRDSMKEREMKDEGELNISVVDKGSDGYPKDAFPENTSSNSELATDEYLFPLMKDRFSDTFAR
jgi:hypothetical protein